MVLDILLYHVEFSKPALFPSSGKGARNLEGSPDRTVLSLGKIEMVNC